MIALFWSPSQPSITSSTASLDGWNLRANQLTCQKMLEELCFNSNWGSHHKNIIIMFKIFGIMDLLEYQRST